MALRTAGASKFVVGTATNDNAAAGTVGEIITSSIPVGSEVTLTTAVTANVTSISVPAGDWHLSAVVNFDLAGTTGTLFQGGASLTSAVLPTQPGGGGLGTDALLSFPVPITGLTGDLVLPGGVVRLSIASTTTVFLTASCTFTVGTCKAFGTITARRIR